MSQRERTCHLIGWLLFLICATFFIVSAVLNGDHLYLAGSIIFFIACVAFLIPLLSPKRHEEAPDKSRRSRRVPPDSSA